MIVGLGIDICDIRRIAQVLDRFGDRFTHRVFTDVERARSDRRADRAGSYARRFAAKEAGAKALGTGVPRRGVSWRDIGVANLAGGQPTLVFQGAAERRLQDLTPPGAVMRVHVTMTDDDPMAQALVILEALSPEQAAWTPPPLGRSDASAEDEA